MKNKALPGLDEPFDYDLLAQLANVPARITMYDLLRLSPDIRQAVVKALSEADKYAPHVHQIQVNDVPQEENRGIQEKMKAEEPDLAFYREDFFLGDLHHNRPLYLSGYIGEVKLRQVQVDPGSAINVIPLKKVRKLGIPCLVLQLKKEDEELGAQFLMPIREGVLDLTRREYA